MDYSIIGRLQSFKKWFEGYEDNFVIIGGTACSLIMNEQELDFRLTHDVDIVLLIETLDMDFGIRFWNYIKDAEYKHCQKSTGKTQFYRFYAPKSKTYPEMLELFSRNIEGLILPDESLITPVPIGDDISSLSAILLNAVYYDFLLSGIRKVEGLPILDEVHLIPFKAKAWLDLSKRKGRGENVDSNDIRKHKRDIYRLIDLISGDMRFALPESVKIDMQEFIDDVSVTVANTPKKEQKAEKVRLEKIIAIYELAGR